MQIFGAMILAWMKYGFMPIFRISFRFLNCCWTNVASNVTSITKVKTLKIKTGGIKYHSLVFVKDALLIFTNHGHEHWKREFVMASVKCEGERSTARDGAQHFELRVLQVMAPNTLNYKYCKWWCQTLWITSTASDGAKHFELWILQVMVPNT